VAEENTMAEVDGLDVENQVEEQAEVTQPKAKRSRKARNKTPRASRAPLKSQTPKPARYARLGDRVFLWVEEGGKLTPRPAFLTDRSEFSGLWSLNIMTPQGAMIPYPAMPWGEEPKAFHWTFDDFVEPVLVEPARDLGQ